MAETTVEALARWACRLNHWRWPEDLPGRPDDFEALDNYSRGGRSKLMYIRPRLEAIEALIGQKEWLRWFHLHVLGETEAEFEDWWEKHTVWR